MFLISGPVLYDNIVVVCLNRYLDCVVESSALQKKEGREVVSEQATLAPLEPRTTSHLHCPSTR